MINTFADYGKHTCVKPYFFFIMIHKRKFTLWALNELKDDFSVKKLL